VFDRHALTESVRFLKQITPFIAANYVKLLPVSLIFEPPPELPLYSSEVQFEDVLPSELLKFFRDHSVTQSVRKTDTGWIIEDTLSVGRGIVTTFEGHHPYEAFGQFLLEQKILSCDDKIGEYTAIQYLPDTVPSRREFEIWVRQSENRAAINFYRRIRTETGMAACLGASYLTHSTFVGQLLGRFFPSEAASETSEHTANTVLNVEVPFLDAIDTETLMSIRRNDGEVFQNFRNELESRLFEVRLESDPERRRIKAEKAFHDLGVVQVHALRTKANELIKSSVLQAVITGATLVASVATGLTPLAPVIAIAGLARILTDYRSSTRANPAFFLWKATKD
jgi:hypothetical protein